MYTNEELIVKWKNQLKYNSLASTTIAKYESAIRQLAAYHNNKPFTEISRDEIKEFIVAKNRSSSTKQGLMIKLNLFYSFLLKEGIISTMPIEDEDKKFKMEKSLPKFLTDKSVKILRQYFKEDNLRNWLMFETMLGTGVRVSELVAMKLSDFFRLDTGELVVRIVGKGEKERLVPVKEDLYEMILDYCNRESIPSTTPIFLNRFGEKMTTTSVERVFIKASELTHIHVTPHRLRHTYATHLRNEGVSLDIIQMLLGHESISTTQIYSKILPKTAVRQALANIPSIDDSVTTNIEEYRVGKPGDRLDMNLALVRKAANR